MTENISIALRLPEPARLEIAAPLARAALRHGRERARPFRRKLVRSLFSLFHRRLGIGAPATLRLANGAAVAVDCRDTAFLDFALRLERDGAVEPEVTALLSHLAPHLRVVYDVGANWGYYPLLLGSEPRFTGEVHAFEVAPRTAAGLERLVREAGLAARVQVHGYGLSRQDGEVLVTRERHSYLARIVAADYRGRAERARVRRLDGLALPPPDLVKIDVEGHEEDVLCGGRELLRRQRPIIVLESWHEPHDRAHMLAPLSFLEGLGYALCRPVWRAGRDPVEGRLDLEPLAAADRPAIAHALNLVAADPERLALLSAS